MASWPTVSPIPADRIPSAKFRFATDQRLRALRERSGQGDAWERDPDLLALAPGAGSGTRLGQKPSQAGF